MQIAELRLEHLKLKKFVESFFDYARKYKPSIEETEEFVESLNNMRAGPKHLAEELERY